MSSNKKSRAAARAAAFCTVEEAIADIAAGKFVIVVDEDIDGRLHRSRLANEIHRRPISVRAFVAPGVRTGTTVARTKARPPDLPTPEP